MYAFAKFVMLIAAGWAGLAADAARADPTPLRLPPPSSLDLSPDGRMLVAVANAAGEGSLRSRKARALTIDTTCLLAPIPSHPCETITALDLPRAYFGYWRPNEQAFVLDSSSPVKVAYETWPLTITTLPPAATSGANKVMRVDPATLPAPTGQAILDSEVRYFSSDGKTVLTNVATDGEARLLWSGGSMVVPRSLYDFGSFMPLRYRVVAKGDGSGFYLWSSSLGQRGQLLEIMNGRPRQVRLPRSLGGPLQPVFRPDGRAVAIFTPDAIMGLGPSSRAAQSITRYARQVRDQDPDLELKRVAVSDDLQTWALLFATVEGRAALHVVRPLESKHAVRAIVAPSEDEAATVSSVSRSTAVDLGPGPAHLPARLYKSRTASVPRRLIITFHGGPPLDTTTTDHPWTPFFAGQGFDVLDVDYRGSSGYGEAHLLALRAPAAAMLLEDLKTAADWGRRRGYREVGFLGTSAGGLAGIAAASASASQLDFLVLESPLIDWPPDAKVKNCRLAGGQTTDRLFGLRIEPDGGCRPRSTNALEAGRYTGTPVLLLQGQQDLRTPASLAKRWVSRGREAGACILTVDSTDGGHTVASWPKSDQDRARQVLRSWLPSIKRGGGCRP